MTDEIQQRWYDQEPTLSQAVNLLESFPMEIQAIIAEGIIDLAEQECQAREMTTSLKSVGTEKILGLHKSKKKRRSSDQHPQVNKAMSYLYLLSPENQKFMAAQIAQVMNYMFDSLETSEVKEVTQSFVAAGNERGNKLLSAIKQRLERSMQNSPATKAVQAVYDGIRIGEIQE